MYNYKNKYISEKRTPDCPGYSDKQHRGNEGEGQFHLNESNIEYHRRNFLERVLTYVDLYNLLEG